MAYVTTEFGSYDGLFDTIRGALQSVIPSKTIVGNLLAGNVSGAAQGTVRLVTSGQRPATAQPLPVAQPAGAFQPGGFVEKNQTMLLVAAGALAFFLVMRKGRR